MKNQYYIIESGDLKLINNLQKISSTELELIIIKNQCSEPDTV
jgi:hypothetical protein